jgi:ABC-type bacteriocin/lantibiotic exporter with double-glycine peptidase domain
MGVKIPVVHKYQTNLNNCGPASLQMVLGYFKTIETQKRLSKRLKTNSDVGTNVSAMINEARRQGFYCYVNNDTVVSEIRYFIARHLPVIILYIEQADNMEHYSVIRGFKGKTFFISDPWSGNIKIKEAEFIARWHDKSLKFNNWLMVLSPEPLGLGKQYRPSKKKI